MSEYHIPVLLKESIEGLNISPDGTYVDVTFGGGGHSEAILSQLTSGRLYAFDQDVDAAKNLIENNKFFFILGNFRYLNNYLRFHGVKQIDGLLADLGVSSHHFNSAERGFSYRADADLDMRMNRDAKLTAAAVINEYEPEKLTEILREYGELFNARKLASAIAETRRKQPIQTTGQLIHCLEPMIPKQAENQFLSKVFQAIRIEVNHELESLEEMMKSAFDYLKPGGRLVVISYHSLEDRYVKNFMRWGNVREQPIKDLFGNSAEPFRLITKKPIEASPFEVHANPRARSARLRIAEKK